MACARRESVTATDGRTCPDIAAIRQTAPQSFITVYLCLSACGVVHRRTRADMVEMSNRRRRRHGVVVRSQTRGGRVCGNAGCLDYGLGSTENLKTRGLT